MNTQLQNNPKFQCKSLWVSILTNWEMFTIKKFHDCSFIIRDGIFGYWYDFRCNRRGIETVEGCRELTNMCRMLLRCSWVSGLPWPGTLSTINWCIVCLPSHYPQDHLPPSLGQAFYFIFTTGAFLECLLHLSCSVHETKKLRVKAVHISWYRDDLKVINHAISLPRTLEARTTSIIQFGLKVPYSDACEFILPIEKGKDGSK